MEDESSPNVTGIYYCLRCGVPVHVLNSQLANQFDNSGLNNQALSLKGQFFYFFTEIFNFDLLFPYFHDIIIRLLRTSPIVPSQR